MKNVAKKYGRIWSLISVDEVQVLMIWDQKTTDATAFPAVAFFIIATKGCSYMIWINEDNFCMSKLCLR
jgi:hypothetical protein